jgi:hypothetical protein
MTYSVDLRDKLPKIMMSSLKFDICSYAMVCPKHHTFCYSSFTKNQQTTISTNQPNMHKNMSTVYAYENVFIG